MSNPRPIACSHRRRLRFHESMHGIVGIRISTVVRNQTLEADVTACDRYTKMRDVEVCPRAVPRRALYDGHAEHACNQHVQLPVR